MVDPKKNIQIISELLEGNLAEYSDYREISSLEEIIYDNFKKAIMNGNYINKSTVINSIISVLLKIKTNSIIPHFIGRAVVGIIGNKEDLFSFINISNNTILDFVCKYNLSIPIIFSQNIAEGICFRNRYNSQIPITKSSAKTVLDFLKNEKQVDINQLFTSIDVNYKGIPGVNLLYFPAASRDDRNMPQDLIRRCDIIAIFCNDQHETDLKLNKLERLKYLKKVIIIDKEKEWKINEDMYPNIKYGLKKGSLEEINKVIEKGVSGTQNYNYSVLILSPLLNVEKYYNNEIKKFKKVLSKLNEDIVLWDENNIHLDGVRNLRDDILANIAEAKKMLEEHQKIRDQIIKHTSIISALHHDKYLQINDINTPEIKLKPDNELVMSWFNNALHFIDLGQYESAEECIKILKKEKFDDIYLLNLYMQKKRKSGYDSAELNKLSNAKKEDQITIKAKVTHYKALGLTKIDAGVLCYRLKDIHSPEECYLLGMYFRDIEYQKAIRYFEESLEAGMVASGSELIELYKKHKLWDEIKIKYLAQLLVPQANYEFGLLNLEQKHFAKGITHLKIAGILGIDKAILKLADLSYAEDKFYRSLALYELLAIKNVNLDSDIIERMGIMYYKTRQNKKAIGSFNKIHTAESNYYLGKLYMTEENRDFHKAIGYLNIAESMGHQEAGKILRSIESKKRNKEYDYTSKGDYSPKSNTTTSNGCFLTTAVCMSLGKSSDCDIIIEFKKFRDDVLKYHIDGINIIEEYYRIAPLLVEIINNTVDREKEYKYLWTKYISTGYKYLLEGKYFLAKKIYISMVLDLKNKFMQNIELD